MSPDSEDAVGRLPPDRIRFSQASVNYRFRDGGTIDDLVEGLKSGGIRVEDLSPLRLVDRGGVMYTLDNRRLEAFRRAGVSAPYRLATPEEVEMEHWKFTTTNDGTSIKVRGERHES